MPQVSLPLRRRPLEGKNETVYAEKVTAYRKGWKKGIKISRAVVYGPEKWE